MLTRRLLILPALFALVAMVLPAAALAAPIAPTTVVVRPSAMDGWAASTFSGTDLTCSAGTDKGSVSFVTGPASPPLGTGSVRFVTTDGDSQQRLRNSDYDGALLSSLTALGYSTYVTKFNDSQAPYLTLYLNTEGAAGVVDDRLHFEPAYQTHASGNATLPDQGALVQGAWQSWDALHGGWYSDSAFATPGTGVKGLADYIAAHPNAKIINSSGGGIRLATGGCSAGSWDNVDSNVDAFTISTAAAGKTYDFEPDLADTTGPVFTPPANQTIVTTGSGAVATYVTPTATDAVDGPVPVTCTPPSGSTFPLGVNTVTCTSTDSHSNTTTHTFTITVVHPTPTPTPQTASSVALMAPSGTITCGQPYTFKATVKDASGQPVPAQTVTWQELSKPAGASDTLAPATSMTDAMGVAQTTLTFSLPNGSRTIQATAGTAVGQAIVNVTGCTTPPVITNVGTCESALGLDVTTGYSHATKLQIPGRYITFRLSLGVLYANASVVITHATRTLPPAAIHWSTFASPTGRTADAKGDVYYHFRSQGPMWISVRASIPAATGRPAAISTACQGRWR